MAFQESRGLETRPIVAGNIAEQPGLQLFPHRSVGDLANSRLIHRNSFYFGNHQGVGPAEREAVASYLQEFIEGAGGRTDLKTRSVRTAGDRSKAVQNII